MTQQNIYSDLALVKEQLRRLLGVLGNNFAGAELVVSNIIPAEGGGTGASSGPLWVSPSFINNSGGTLNAGDCVVLDTTMLRAVKKSTTEGDLHVVGVVRGGPYAAAAETPVMTDGHHAAVNVTGAVAAGDYLELSTTSGLAKSTGSGTPNKGAFARAEVAFAGPGAGTVAAYVFPIDISTSVSGRSYLELGFCCDGVEFSP